MTAKIESKREREKLVVAEMIGLYCRKQHHRKKKDGLCPDCAALRDYAWMRSDKCPFMETKSFCVNCKVHCYRPEMRERIREVMRFAGPRMIFYRPGMAISHAVSMLKEKKKLKQK